MTASSTVKWAKCTTPTCKNQTVEGFCVPCQGGASANGSTTKTQTEPKTQTKLLPPYCEERSSKAVEGGLSLGSKAPSSELDELRAAYHAGALKPIEVQLGPIPAHFGSAQRAVAEDTALLMGLRLAEGEDRPLPYPSNAAVSAGLAGDKIQASRILRRLVNAGVVVDAGQLKEFKARDGRLLDGTKLYSPPERGET